MRLLYFVGRRCGYSGALDLDGLATVRIMVMVTDNGDYECEICTIPWGVVGKLRVARTN